MNVGMYLKRKEVKDVFSITPESTVTECIDLLNEKGIGALIVINDQDCLEGIVSERDILRKGCGCANTSKKVKDIMTPKSRLITTNTDTNIVEVMEKLDHNKIRHLPVMEGEKVIGVVSITDVINELRKLNIFENEQLKKYILSPL